MGFDKAFWTVMAVTSNLEHDVFMNLMSAVIDCYEIDHPEVDSLKLLKEIAENITNAKACNYGQIAC